MHKIIIIVASIFLISLLGGGVWLFLSLLSNDSSSSVHDSQIQGLETTYKSEDAKKVFDNPDIGISFSYPEKGKTQIIEEEGWKMVMVRDETGREVQVAISDFSEAGPITVSRIKQDISDTDIKNIKPIKINSNDGVYFETQTTREIWFASKGKLYQVSELIGGTLMEAVVGTMRI